MVMVIRRRRMVMVIRRRRIVMVMVIRRRRRMVMVMKRRRIIAGGDGPSLVVRNISHPRRSRVALRLKIFAIC